MRGQSPRNLFGRRRGATPQRQGRARLLITSRENEKLKLVRKLHQRRWRDKLGLFIAEGEDLVAAAQDAGFEAVEVLVAGEDVEPGLLAEVTTLGHPPRVIGVFRRTARSDESVAASLSLWRVSDPGNVGTLIRAADAFGAAVQLSEGCADPFGPKALRAGMGSTFRVPLRPFEILPGSVALVAAGGAPLDEVDLERYPNFVLGAEREGLPEDVAGRCDVAATIPLRDAVDSLNVAMAGTIALYSRWRKAGV